MHCLLLGKSQIKHKPDVFNIYVRRHIDCDQTVAAHLPNESDLIKVAQKCIQIKFDINSRLKPGVIARLGTHLNWKLVGWWRQLQFSIYSILVSMFFCGGVGGSPVVPSHCHGWMKAFKLSIRNHSVVISLRNSSHLLR